MSIKCILFSSLVLFFSMGSIAQDQGTNPLDEFRELSTDSVVTDLSNTTGFSTPAHKKNNAGLYWTISVLAITAVAGVFVRFKHTRHLRSAFLVISLVVLGFYRSGCPCSIQSLQHGILALLGNPFQWPSVLLFAGLIPVTYLFGKVYCGWVCHLGALQEFIFRSSGFKILQTKRSQTIMRRLRMLALIVLIGQLLLTESNLYREIDPFGMIFNFYSKYWMGWVLVTIVIVSSIVLYRPFCRTLCPVGLILGWTAKIPGASLLGIRTNCISCVQCSRKCSIKAISHDTRISILENQDCIRCGECLDHCSKSALGFFRKNQKHPDVVTMERVPPLKQDIPVNRAYETVYQ